MALAKDELCPEFSGLNQDGNEISLKDFKGHPLILYFYPKDHTPGCTLESCGFRDVYQEIKTLGAEVVGVSKDSVASHQKFVQKHDLPFNIIADTQTKMCEDFDVLAEKSMFGRKYMGIVRTTYLIDKNGKIVTVWPKVSVAGHIKDVLKHLKDL